VVVAQNKIDLVDKKKVLENYEKIKKFLKDYGYGDSPVIPTSANFGANIDLLIEAIQTHIVTPKYDLKKPLKMFVARSFDINKPGADIKNLNGAVLGGSISQGTVKVGDEIQIYPGLEGETKTKVTSIATSTGLIKEATPGGLMAIGTTLDPSIAQNDQLRGKIIAKVGSMPAPIKELKMSVNLFERASAEKTNSVIKINDPLVLTIGTNTGIGITAKSDGKTVELILKNEVIVEKGERIAISKNINSQWRLIAYGEVM